MRDSHISAAKTAALLARVQTNPEILTSDATYMSELITRAANFLVTHANLPRYPELAQGYVQSGASPGTDLSALTTNEFQIDVNRSGLQSCTTLVLANCTSGAATASALQTAIRAIDTEKFDEVTVAYANSLYTVTSGRYGERSRIQFRFNETNKHIVQSLKLAPVYGAVEVRGMEANTVADDIVVAMVEAMYRKIGIEGADNASVPGDVSITFGDLTPEIRRAFGSIRRLW